MNKPENNNMKTKKINILSTKVSLINYSIATKTIKKKIKQHQRNYVCVAASHLLVEAYENKKLQKGINNALMVTPDGMPLVWLSKFKNKITSRVYGPNLMLKLCNLSQKHNYKIFLLGGAKHQGKVLIKHLTKQFPKINISGFFETPIRPIPTTQNNQLIKILNSQKPDIIFVGLGCPLQEQWMIDNYHKLDQGICIGVGAAFDFISKRIKQAPEWMQNIGLEWLFRLSQDPKRLWKRYTLTNAKFIYYLIKSFLK